jgi:pyruvate,water dikinase
MSNIMWFDDPESDLCENTGGKGASLSKMSKVGLPVPGGFIITAPFFYSFIVSSSLFEKIQHIISGINFDNFKGIEERSKEIQKLIIDTPFPASLRNEVLSFYEELGMENQPVAVRSSSTAEDLDEASFAGQQDTYLYVVGNEDLLDKIKKIWASLYNGSAMFYRKQKGFDEAKIAIAVVVQKMVDSEKSGVMFTVNPISKVRNHLLIESVWGLGEGIVSGCVTPDNFTVDKTTHEILEENISEKETMFVRNFSLKGVDELEVPESKRNSRVLTDMELEELVNLAVKLEKFFGKPQDVEWAIVHGKVNLLQSRPITTLEKTDKASA